jgi:uncharacterized membrane protein
MIAVIAPRQIARNEQGHLYKNEGIMTPVSITTFIALLSTGLLTGILLGNRLGSSLALPKLPDSSFVRFQQEVHLRYVRFMPPLQIASILGSLAWLYLVRDTLHGSAFALLVAASLGTCTVFAITMFVNVPVNKKLMTWNAAAPPTDVRQQWIQWETGNTIRTILAAGVFTLQVLVVSLASSTLA